jgi:hypothetical protein
MAIVTLIERKFRDYRHDPSSTLTPTMGMYNAVLIGIPRRGDVELALETFRKLLKENEMQQNIESSHKSQPNGLWSLNGTSLTVCTFACPWIRIKTKSYKTLTIYLFYYEQYKWLSDKEIFQMASHLCKTTRKPKETHVKDLHCLQRYSTSG